MDVEQGRAAGHAFGARDNHLAKLVDQPGAQQRPVGGPATFQEQAAYA